MSNSVQIEHYEFGTMKIGGQDYHNDVTLFPDHVSPDWWREKGHSLSVADLDEIIEYNPDILIVGKGASGILQIPIETRDAINKNGIQLIEGLTDDAVLLFNEKVAVGLNVAGAFHLTC